MKPKDVVAVSNAAVKGSNTNQNGGATRITLSPLLSCIESEQDLFNSGGLFVSSVCLSGDVGKFAIFQQTAVNFRQRTLWVLKINFSPYFLQN